MMMMEMMVVVVVMMCKVNLISEALPGVSATYNFLLAI